MTILKITSNDFHINEVSLSLPIDIENLNNILGNFDRYIKGGPNTIFTWDELGMTAYSENGKLVETIQLILKKEKFHFSPKNEFKGKLFLENKEVSIYYQSNNHKLIKRFNGDDGAFIFNNISVSLSKEFLDKNSIELIEIDVYK